MRKRLITVAIAVTAIALTASACSSSKKDNKSTSPAGPGSSSPMTSAMTSPSSSADAAQFGSACSMVPTDPTNAGSFDAMSKVPVATAASGNPLLSTLVTAVKAAGLVDTLNNATDITVFAPDNAAFAKIPKATLAKVLADKALLTKILTYHVIPKRLTPAEVTGTLATLEKGSVMAAGSVPNITVGPKGTEANVICGNVQTANATVYIIDSVMMPAS